MVSAIQAAMQAAISSTRAVRGQAVTYRRGATELDVSLAVRGATQFDVENVDGGANITERSLDWIVSVDELTTDAGTVLTPQRGDEIVDQNGVVYRVMPFGPDEQLWIWHDRESQTVRRIHTKERR
jgi:hypothetical protein